MAMINRERKELTAKVLLLGDGGVGKTTLRMRYMGKIPQSSYYATLGADFSYKEFKYYGFKVRFQIWDIAGQIHFRSMNRSFYQGASAAIILFDVTNRTSFESVTSWLDEIHQMGRTRGNIPVVIIGNKIDARSGDRGSISLQEGENLAKALRGPLQKEIPYLETSALTSEKNIADAFELIANHYLKVKPAKEE